MPGTLMCVAALQRQPLPVRFKQYAGSGSNDADGKLSRKTEYYSYSSASKTVYEYDSHENMIKISVYDNDALQYWYEYEYEYFD